MQQAPRRILSNPVWPGSRKMLQAANVSSPNKAAGETKATGNRFKPLADARHPFGERMRPEG